MSRTNFLGGRVKLPNCPRNGFVFEPPFQVQGEKLILFMLNSIVNKSTKREIMGFNRCNSLKLKLERQ